MADKGIIVEDAASGESVACVDARNNDDDGNPRVIQLASNVTSPGSLFDLSSDAPTRFLNFSGGKGDDYDVTTLNVSNSGMIDIADAEAVVVQPALQLPDTPESQMIMIGMTPLLINNHNGVTMEFAGALPVSIIRPLSMQSMLLDQTDTDQCMHMDVSGTNIYLAPAFTYPSLGAPYMAFHLRSHVDTNTIVALYVWTLTGPGGLAYTPNRTADEFLAGSWPGGAA